MDSSICDREWLSSVNSQSSIRHRVLPLSILSFMNLINFSVFLIFFMQIFSTSQALPIVDKGVFVITGVKTCGVNGSGYCVLGPDCSVDKEFEPMLDDPNEIENKIEETTTLQPTLEELINSPLKSQIKNSAKPKNHCDGLRNAFTPSAEFSCCQYVNTNVNNTQSSINQYFGQNVVTNTSSGVSLVTKPQNEVELEKPEVVQDVELNTGNYFTKNSTITSTTTEQDILNTTEINNSTTSTTTTSKSTNVNKTNQNTSSASEESKSEESQEDSSKSKESPESDEKEPEMSIETELENIHKPDGFINKTLQVQVSNQSVVESTTIETQTEINLLQESISVVHLTDEVHDELPIEQEPVEKAKDDKNQLKVELEQLLDKCNSNSNFSPRNTHNDIFSQYKYANIGTNRRLIANNNDNKGRVAIPGYGNQNIFKNSGEECHYTVAIVRRPSLLTSFSNVNTFSDPGSFICAGALVSSRVIVTSATCVSRLIFINNSYFKQSFRNNGRNATNSNSKEDEHIYNQYLQMFRVVIGTKHILHPSRLYRLLLSNPNAFENTSNEINMREIERIKIHDGYKLLNAATSTGEQSHNIRVNDIALVILKSQAYEGVKNITEHQRDLKNLQSNKKYIVNHDDDEEPMVDDELEEFDDLDDDLEEISKPQLNEKKTKINSPQQNQNNLDFQQEINMDVKVCPICLPSYNHQGSGEHVDTNNYNHCLVTGYSHPTSESSSESDGIFHEAYQEIHNQDDNCLFYSNTFYDESSQNNNNHTDSNYNIKNTVLCASSGNNAEACFSPRDSGSPLSCSSRKSENKFLLGVFSNGFHCAGSNSPVLYTDVRNYVNWILENV